MIVIAGVAMTVLLYVIADRLSLLYIALSRVMMYVVFADVVDCVLDDDSDNDSVHDSDSDVASDLYLTLTLFLYFYIYFHVYSYLIVYLYFNECT